MTEQRARAAIAFLALAGAGIASYLLYERYTGGRIACPNSGCETVQHSRYAKVAGIPVALGGLLGYLGLIATALRQGEAARAGALAIALVAVSFSAYLLVVQLVVIDAVCVWCVGSDVVATLILLLTLARIAAAGRATRALAGLV